MPVVGLTEAMAVAEAAPSWMWTLTLIGPDGLVIPAARISDAPANFIEISAEAVNNVNGLPMSFPAGATLNSMDVIFHESFTYDMTYNMLKWKNKVRDRLGNYGLPLNYLGTGIFMYHDTCGIPQYIFEVEGLWPTAIHSWSNNYTESNAMTVGVSFETFNHYGDTTLIGTVEDLVTDLVGDIPVVNAAMSIGASFI